MPTRIDLPPDLEAFTRTCIASGRYTDTNDVIHTALRHLQDAEKRSTTFNAMLDETEAEAARNGTHDIDDVLAEVDAIIEAAEREQARESREKRMRSHPSNQGPGRAMVSNKT